MMFKKATKAKAKLRLALIGPSGSGKTYSALAIGSGLGDKVALIDTERGSASKYGGYFNFDVLELETFSVDNYMAAITEAIKSGYDVLIIDSLSHAWAGRDGILEYVDKKSAANPGSNSFVNWRSATPLHNKLVDTILSAPIHIIATMRSKMDYVLEKDERTGKMTPRKVGLAPVQRDGVEYEFDLVGDMTPEHRLVVTKSRIPELSDEVIDKPGKPLGKKLKDWLDEGTAAPAATPAAAPPKAAEAIEDLDSITLIEAMNHIVTEKGPLAGKRLGDYDMATLNTILVSTKATPRLKAMAELVLDQKELSGEGLEEPAVNQQRLGA